MHEPLSNLRPIIFVQFANGTPRKEVWRGLQRAAARQAATEVSSRKQELQDQSLLAIRKSNRNSS
jgi:hypothetical protein